ncbi:TetR/AcrR family transcriptional regulator [Mycobacteroides franklinii]|uniref:HTH-type transcriptional regulator AcrR n=1 Tax=Mycobacteroides franklinii TaxID=948102 RepID=A0A4R8RDY9_9MYCO|nr:TetR/AcrR family transcriptional regulator [Mycobacteroides franklinii]TDZ45945.1 HTH-type transcriptional regulator AcrR [Mycobacteroides franklinii]TDZ53560.1 HTH-type transcriptional regulator AcrR [Mycobacteroides franklinii]TDZ59615.1 HTH-type transcriptional regulator AcrR [Mycobacteroides franklinii]TDZ67130.1 HTH-type transcriptional regulator AcrR [Mycobacteroides franklinii]TDZ73054.1 HTH-type transcriptional regulator AcrR [Mycobacteroides franklinii]
MADDEAKIKARRGRADGEISRGRILDAATEIAAERGYEGTSISAVSAKCGLPASSIYWHFKDKDALLAAVIERSFTTWLSGWELPAEGSPIDRAESLAAQTAKAVLDSPDFLRLGLMLALERRPVEPQARARFLQVRAEAQRLFGEGLLSMVPGLSQGQVHELTTYALAGSDGLFIAKEIGGDAVDLAALLAVHARAVVDHATRMLAEGVQDPTS